jgi:hypothetical protein
MSARSIANTNDSYLLYFENDVRRGRTARSFCIEEAQIKSRVQCAFDWDRVRDFRCRNRPKSMDAMHDGYLISVSLSLSFPAGHAATFPRLEIRFSRRFYRGIGDAATQSSTEKYGGSDIQRARFPMKILGRSSTWQPRHPAVRPIASVSRGKLPPNNAGTKTQPQLRQQLPARTMVNGDRRIVVRRPWARPSRIK